MVHSSGLVGPLFFDALFQVATYISGQTLSLMLKFARATKTPTLRALQSRKNVPPHRQSSGRPPPPPPPALPPLVKVQDDALLMKITGEDQTGIMARMTDLLADAESKFYDGQCPYPCHQPARHN